MVFETTIDQAGRVVIPQKLRRDLHLLPGTRLRITEHGRSVVLEPVEEEPVFVVRDGVKLLGGAVEGEAPTYAEAREDWLDTMTKGVLAPSKARKPK